jgi:S1-C subfamily serine protease
MRARRLLFFVSLLAIAASFFAMGVFHARGEEAEVRASVDARLDAMQAEVRGARSLTIDADVRTAGTSGRAPLPTIDVARAGLVEAVKQELQSEMGLVPVRLLRDRRSSFVELYCEDNFGKTSYGTAGYLGDGYFLTVKHAVVSLGGDEPVLYQGRDVPATLVDAGDADSEVHSGDWAVIKTRAVDLPALHPNAAFTYDFAEPIFRLGNDYSQGIIVSTGYVGQRMPNGLVTALTDGHPGVSGGGVLDRQGDLVGIPIGRMQGDYRFSFILPIRTEMFRKLPGSPTSVLATH